MFLPRSSSPMCTFTSATSLLAHQPGLPRGFRGTSAKLPRQSRSCDDNWLAEWLAIAHLLPRRFKFALSLPLFLSLSLAASRASVCSCVFCLRSLARFLLISRFAGLILCVCWLALLATQADTSKPNKLRGLEAKQASEDPRQASKQAGQPTKAEQASK